MKKLIASSVLASSILFPTITSADHASFPIKIKVEKTVNIRKGATTSYSIVKTLKSGQQVTVIDEFINSSGQKWYRVDLGNVKGWAISTFFSNNVETSNNQVGTINGSKVNVRKGATTSYKTVDTLSKGKKVTVIDSFKSTNGQLWYRIQYGTIKGWILGEYLQTNFAKSQSATQTPQTTNYKTVVNNTVIRKGATTSYPSIGLLTKNQKVSILDAFTNAKKEEWFRIKSGNKIGWVIGTAFSKPSTTIPVNMKEIQVAKAVIRKGADESYKIVANLSLKQKLNIIDTYTSPSGEKWYRVEYGQIKGWVVSTAFDNMPIIESLYVGTHNTFIYTGATYKDKVIEKIPFKNKVNVTKEIQNSNQQTWVQIQTQSGKVGWIPKMELYKSSADLSYVFALNQAVVRKGASPNYAIAASLKENDQLLTLQEVNGWLNIETASGKRGWILKDQTSPISLKRFITPSTYVDGNNSYLVWQKPMNFKFTYSTTSNQLKITQGITDVELPSFNVAGIQSIDTVKTSANEKSIVLTFAPGYTFTIRNYSDKVSIKVLPTGLLGKKIIVDAGHGGKDTGAIGPNGLLEKDTNLGTALLLKAELEKAGAIVTLTRGTDIFLELSERTDIANLSDADAFISIHCNSFNTTSKGSATYYNTSVNFNGPRSILLGQDIQQNLVSSLNTYNRGVVEQDFYVNRMNELPSVLVELAFISNPKEEALLRSNSFRQNAAIGIRKGLEQYFKNF